MFNPIALRRAKTLLSFGPSECKRVNFAGFGNDGIISHTVSWLLFCDDALTVVRLSRNSCLLLGF